MQIIPLGQALRLEQANTVCRFIRHNAEIGALTIYGREALLGVAEVKNARVRAMLAENSKGSFGLNGFNIANRGGGNSFTLT